MSEKRLYRSTTDRRIAGICGGLAEYFGLDATLMRVIYFVALVLPGGIGILPYIVLWIVLPEGDGGVQALASSAVTIAEERYARGEIDADELARIRQDLTAVTIGWWGWGPDVVFFGLLPLLFLGGLIVIGVVLIGSPKSAPSSSTSALSILEERYARGEITRDEFIERRNTLRGSSKLSS